MVDEGSGPYFLGLASPHSSINLCRSRGGSWANMFRVCCSSSISLRIKSSMNWDLVRMSPFAILASSHSLTGLVKVIVRSTFSGPLGRAISSGIIRVECNKYAPMHYKVLSG